MIKEGTALMFNYVVYKALLKKIDESEDQKDQRQELHEMVEDGMKSCLNYVNAVDMMELAMPRIMASLSGDDMREKIAEYDKSRKIAHDAAIAYAGSLNRIAIDLGLDPLYMGDLNDRYQVGDYCIDVVSTLFKNRVK